MSLFDLLVDSALQGQPGLAPLRPVVEKELLHQDILRELSEAGLLQRLTFIGGTCLRLCYGSQRLSEDLDFTGGSDFDRETLGELSAVLVTRLQQKYGLQVSVDQPVRESGNVDTWRVKLQTRPDRRDLPAQRINIDICAVPSYQVQPMMLRNHYGVDMGASGLIISAQSRAEILADKLVALALRPNRIKNRDLWDIVWLHQQGTELPLALIPLKLRDHHCALADYSALLQERQASLAADPAIHAAFKQEMRRFVAVGDGHNMGAGAPANIVETENYWQFLCYLMGEHARRITEAL
jgi:predicted nucleotidyltransferase component of viral defense system